MVLTVARKRGTLLPETRWTLGGRAVGGTGLVLNLLPSSSTGWGGPRRIGRFVPGFELRDPDGRIALWQEACTSVEARMERVREGWVEWG